MPSYKNIFIQVLLLPLLINLGATTASYAARWLKTGNPYQL